MIDRLAAVLAMFATLAISQSVSASVPGQLHANELRCEYRINPLAIDTPAPRLSWVVDAERRGEIQTAYRILVASTADLLASDTGDLWDTGKVASNVTAHIVYAGKPLTSRQSCHWKVMVWDRNDHASAWSEPARWEMGLLKPEDWSAEWIVADARPVSVEVVAATYAAIDGSASVDVRKAVAAMVERGEPIVASNEALGGDPAFGVRKRLHIEYRIESSTLHAEINENVTAVLAQRMPYLRQAFTIDKPVARARLYATALGMYEPFLNGTRVGENHLAPGWTDYRKRVHYQTFDVTDQLVQGRNAIGAIVAPGWFAGRAGLFNIRQFYGDTPALLAQLEITFADGTTERITTDHSWRRTDGPYLAADLMDGVMYDARAEIEHWCDAAFDDSEWEHVETRDEARRLQAMVDEPVRIWRQVPATTVTEPQPGRWTFDLGQNIVGVVRLSVRAPAGTVVTIQHGELLNDDGTVYTDNLRGAAATDAYICNGKDIETWMPQFIYHGFRYVEVTGLERAPRVDAVTGLALSSDIPAVGTFECSDANLTQLQSNIIWGLRGNYVSIPTDCPQRDERMGWMADTQVFVPTAAYNVDVAAFMTKWMDDVADAQRADGAHSDVAPVMRGLSFGTPAWADAGVIVPWLLYQYYGDTRIFEAHIDSMMRWVDWCTAHSTDLIRDHARGNDYGDWLSINADTPKDLIGTAYFAHAADIVSRSLKVLNRREEEAHYRQLFESIREAFVQRYVSANGTIAGDTQCAYVLALKFDLLPESARRAAQQRLVQDIKTKHNHLSTGFVGVSHLLSVLAAGGFERVAYDVLMQDTFPSWLFSVKHGATTIWERWDGWTPERGPHPDITMNSFNHYALGSCGEWLYAGVAGIMLDSAHPGFEHFFVKPCVDDRLTWARATYRSIRGEIVSGWRMEGDNVTYEIIIPANTSATVTLYTRDGNAVLESGKPLAEADGVRVQLQVDRAIVMQLGSGTYQFTAPKPVSRSGNPFLTGWYADPEVARFGDTYWIYPTFSAPYDEQLHFDAFSSKDLVTWTKHERVLTSGDMAWARRAMWAPSVVENNGKYYFFFAANDIQSDDEPGGIGVAVSDSPAGPFKDHLGEPLIEKFHNGAQPIDQFAFRDDDGQWYLIYGGWRHCNIARLRNDFRGFEPFGDGTVFKEITPELYVEGPFMLKRDGKYYFMWSEGGWTGPDYSVAYAIGDSPLGPFKRVGKILEQDPAIASGAGHHSVLHVNETDQYFIIYHRRPLGETDRNHRVVCIDRLTFREDGTIAPVRMTFDGVDAVDLNEIRKD